MSRTRYAAARCTSFSWSDRRLRFLRSRSSTDSTVARPVATALDRLLDHCDVINILPAAAQHVLAHMSASAI